MRSAILFLLIPWIIWSAPVTPSQKSFRFIPAFGIMAILSGMNDSELMSAFSFSPSLTEILQRSWRQICASFDVEQYSQLISFTLFTSKEVPITQVTKNVGRRDESHVDYVELPVLREDRALEWLSNEILWRSVSGLENTTGWRLIRQRSEMSKRYLLKHVCITICLHRALNSYRPYLWTSDNYKGTLHCCIHDAWSGATVKQFKKYISLRNDLFFV